MKPCRICATPFPATGNQRYCSVKCRVTARRQQQAIYRAQHQAQIQAHRIVYRSRPEARKLRRERARRYYQKYREGRLAYGAAYRERPAVIERLHKQAVQDKRRRFARVCAAIKSTIHK